MQGRQPPSSLDTEACVLSACLLDAEALDKVAPFLKPEHFYSEANGRVYEACTELQAAGQPVDVVQVARWLRDKGRLAQVGGPAYLAQLTDATPAIAHVEHHAKSIREYWRLRQLIATCQRTAAEGYGSEVGVIQEFVEAHEAAVYELARPEGGNSDDAVMLGPAIRETFAAMQAAQERGEQMSGTPTGFERLDAKTAGQHDGDLTIVAARPGVGKTSFVMNIGVNVASPRALTTIDENGYEVRGEVPGLGVVVFSLEMPREQLTARIVCSEAHVDLGKLRQGMLQPEDWRRMTDAAARLSDLPLWIDDAASQTVLGMRAKVRRIQAQYNRPAKDGQPERRVGLVIADYLQLLKSRDGLSSREQEISEISRGLKQLAKELKVPVIALSQLNRDVEKRGKNGRPQLSDLRESGAIEQDADTIIFIYRDEMANPDTDARGIAELIIGKQRNGPTGKVLLRFSSACTRFDNLDPRDYPSSHSDE